ncbi:hypothetical protein FNV43_RR26368 [Rhamnella rubrinervis]|uniref:O-fucosyltransferase family protein n=1 Tax=Rhamnella rubrinervis TaxID=2594499 RepID=A0A8K0GJK1_9ROSA|nr:hypothetical protein FNV43_RR26368 [Rhamnella rubrinervis]
MRIKVEELNSLFTVGQSRLTQLILWVLGVTAMLLVCSYVIELSSMRDVMRSRVFMLGSSQNISLLQTGLPVYDNNGFLIISANGGLNQMRAGICDMVAIARYLNVTLIIPELDKTSFWHDRSRFEDIFDVDYFISSLKDQVRILKEIPDKQKQNSEVAELHPIAPRSWSDISYYEEVILPSIKKNQVLHFNQTDFRLANNHLPEDLQKFRCQVNYKALRFTKPIEELGQKIVRLLRKNGPFLVLHLRYEKDMLAFSGCTDGCNHKEIAELTQMRFAYPWWKQKLINPVKRRKAGDCPLTPEETALALRALDIDPHIQIYIAAGDIYGGERRMTPLRLAFPHFVKKESLLDPSELKPFLNHSNQMAALDYIVSLESDIFVPTYKGNMARLVEGHRRYMGFKTTILLDRKLLVNVVDEYRNGSLSWNEFSNGVKKGHADRMGGPTLRRKIPRYPMLEDYFYANPQECLPPT